MSFPSRSFGPFEVKLSEIAKSHSLRCDSRYYLPDFVDEEERIRSEHHIELGSYFPSPLVKGSQPANIDNPTEESIPVVNTASIQNLSIDMTLARHITSEDYEKLSTGRQLVANDVLLTVDGGVSIGKTAMFDGGCTATVDSHILVLRPSGIEPLTLMYLLASPIAQRQFTRFESGASGQTSVTEDDIRRFVFPTVFVDAVRGAVPMIEQRRREIEQERQKLNQEEAKIWDFFATNP